MMREGQTQHEGRQPSPALMVVCIEESRQVKDHEQRVEGVDLGDHRLGPETGRTRQNKAGE